MSEPLKNLKTLVKSGSTDEYDGKLIYHAITVIIRYMIMPALLWYGSVVLDKFTSQMEQLKKEVASNGARLESFQNTFDGYRAVIDKQLEFLEYRIRLLEVSLYGGTNQFYPELQRERGSGQTTNASAMGKSPIVKQPNSSE